MLTKSQREELERLLRNYLLAISQSAGGAGHPMWNQVARGARAAPGVPVLYGEAERTQRALGAMEPYLSRLLKLHYFELGIADDKAARCKLHRATYWKWVGKAEDRFIQCYHDAHTSALVAAFVVTVDVDMDAPFTLPKLRRKRKQKRKQSYPQSHASKGAQP